MVLGKLKYSVSREAGGVAIDWESMPTSGVMLETLQDWIYELQKVYDEKRNEVFNKREQA